MHQETLSLNVLKVAAFVQQNRYYTTVVGIGIQMTVCHLINWCTSVDISLYKPKTRFLELWPRLET